MAGPHSDVALQGAFNVRDLGGLSTHDGRQTTWGRLFRSDSLHALTPSDADLLAARGLASVIDLRTPSEVLRLGKGPLGGGSIDYIEAPVTRTDAPVVDPTHSSPDLPLAQRYLAYLDEGASGFVRAVTAMAETVPAPQIFCCFFGKDRSGVLAALVLSALGVDSTEIVRDYAASTPGVDALLQHMRSDPIYADTIDRTPPHVLAATQDTMTDFLHQLDRRHGGGRNWFLQAGVTPEQLQRLSDHLLD